MLSEIHRNCEMYMVIKNSPSFFCRPSRKLALSIVDRVKTSE